MNKFDVDGHVYSQTDLQSLRDTIIDFRNAALEQEAFRIAIVLTHVVSILFQVLEDYPDEEKP